MRTSNVTKVIVLTFAIFVYVGLCAKQHVFAETPMIILDPGHGGSDPGATNFLNGKLITERELNLELSIKIKNYLAPFTSNVLLTRSSNEYVSLTNRTIFANQRKPDLFVSIHHDSGGNPLATGISTHYSSYRANLDMSDAYILINGVKYPFLGESKEHRVYYYKDKSGLKQSVTFNNGSVYDPTPLEVVKRSKLLSDSMADSLAALGYKRMYTATGSQDHNLYVTRWTDMPSILIENGFMSNTAELLKITDPVEMERKARTIANTIIAYFDSLPVQMNKVIANKVSPQLNDSNPIQVTADATGGSAKLYRFHILTDGKWRLLQDYSTSNTFTWIPTNPGQYKFSVHVKDKNSTKSYDDYKTLDYTINEAPVKVTSLLPSVESPQSESNSESIKLSAAASGGKEKLYKFYAYDGQNWTVLRDYASTPSINWNPEAGNYRLVVHVKDKDSTNAYDSYTYIEYAITKAPVIVNSVTTLDSNQLVGNPINIVTAATGGNELLYRPMLYDGTKWTVLSDYLPSNKFIWTPEESGSYKIRVHVKDKDSENEFDDFSEINVTVKSEPVKLNNLTADLNSPEIANVPITLTVDAVGGENKLYKFHVHDGTAWIVLQDYAPSNTYEWMADKAGKYKFSVHVKDEKSIRTYDDYGVIDYLIMNKASESKLTTDLKSPQPEGSTIQLQANAIGGAKKLYSFHVFNGETWSVLREFSTSNNLNWTPPKPGEYKLVTHVKDKHSPNAYDSYAFVYYTMDNVPVHMSDINLSLSSPQPANTAITLTANAVGGSSKLFQFHVFDGVTWKPLTDYRTSNDFVWNPSKPGNYKFSVHVKDADSENRYDDYQAFYYTIKP